MYLELLPRHFRHPDYQHTGAISRAGQELRRLRAARDRTRAAERPDAHRRPRLSRWAWDRGRPAGPA